MRGAKNSRVNMATDRSDLPIGWLTQEYRGLISGKGHIEVGNDHNWINLFRKRINNIFIIPYGNK
jgi:hypothetical protein